MALLLSLALAGTARADASPAAAPRPGASEPSPESNILEAQKHHERAVALYDAGDLAGARRELEHAYELAPTFRALPNLGSVSAELQDYAAAADYFERYLAEGGATLTAERRAQVAARLADILPRVAQLEVRVNVAGAEITIDDRLVGVSPLRDSLRVNPGTHRIGARATGWQPHGSVLELVGGKHLTVELQLLRSAAEAPLPPETDATRSKPVQPRDEPNTAPADRAVPWLAWGASAALAGAAVFSGIRALDEDRAHDSKREQLGITRAELDASRSSVHHWSLAADAFTAAALVMSGVSLYLTLKPATKAHDTSQAATWQLRACASRLQLEAQF